MVDINWFACFSSIGCLLGIILFLVWILRRDNREPKNISLSHNDGWSASEPEVELFFNEHWEKKWAERTENGTKPDPHDSYEQYEGMWRTKGYANQARKGQAAREQAWKEARDKVRNARTKMGDHPNDSVLMDLIRKLAEERAREAYEKGVRDAGKRSKKDVTDYQEGTIVEPKRLPPPKKGK